MQSTLYRVTQKMQHIYIEVPTNRKVGEQYFHCICRIKETLTRNVISFPFLLRPAHPADFSTWGSMISNVQPFPPFAHLTLRTLKLGASIKQGSVFQNVVFQGTQ